MPDLGRIARCTSLVCQIYGIENRRLFIDIFSVDLARSHHKPAFFLLVSTDPEEDGHESFFRFLEIAERWLQLTSPCRSRRGRAGRARPTCHGAPRPDDGGVEGR